MKAVFLGSPPFALPSLVELAASHEVVAVVTQPDRPKGRGRRVLPPAVKVEAERRSLPVLQPTRLREASLVEQLRSLSADVFVVVAYGRIIRRELLEMPRLGCFNVHASLLPKYRGAAPIQHAIRSGERETGVTIMRLDEGLDTGPVLSKRSIPITDEDTAGSIAAQLAAIGAALLLTTLDQVEGGRATENKQDDSAATQAPKITKDDARIDFGASAEEVFNLVRAMDPLPGAWTTLAGQPLRLFAAQRGSGSAPAGSVVSADSSGLVIACGSGAVRFGEVQAAGRKHMPAGDYLRGNPLEPGGRLGT